LQYVTAAGFYRPWLNRGTLGASRERRCAQMRSEADDPAHMQIDARGSPRRVYVYDGATLNI